MHESLPSPEQIVMKTPLDVHMVIAGLQKNTKVSTRNAKGTIIRTAALHFIANVSSILAVMLNKGHASESAEFDDWAQV